MTDFADNALDSTMAEPNARDQALEAEKARLKAEKAGFDAEQAVIDAMKEELIAREKRLVSQEEWVKAEKESLKTANGRTGAVHLMELDLEEKMQDYFHRKLEFDVKTHDCSALKGLKLTLELMEDAGTHIALTANLKDTLVLQVRHLLANEAGLDLTILNRPSLT
jgi:hypothetical protein